MAAVPNMVPLAVAVDVPNLPRSIGGRRAEVQRPTILRSTLKTPIAEQVRNIDDAKAEFLDAVKKAKQGNGPLPFTLGDLMNCKNPEKNPAHLLAAGEVARLLVDSEDGFVAERHAIDIFSDCKLSLTKVLKEEFPATLAQLEVSEKAPDRNNVVKSVLRMLNIIRLPVQMISRRAGCWNQNQFVMCWIPNIGGASDDEVKRQIELFYRVRNLESETSTTLTAAQVSDLKAIVPDGCGPLIEYMIAKLASPQIRRELGIVDGRARSVVARFDALTDTIAEMREVAELRVAGKVIRTTGEGVKNAKRAVNHMLQSTVNKHDLLREHGRKASTTHRSFVDRFGAELKPVLHELALSQDPSYKVGDATPVDGALIHNAWTGPGGFCEHFHDLLQVYLASDAWAPKHPDALSCSLSTTKKLLKHANIQYLANENQRPTVLSMHYCASSVKMFKLLFTLFGAYATITSIDAKSLLKCGVGTDGTKQFQITDMRSQWGKPDHSAGADHLYKISLYSMWLLPLFATIGAAASLTKECEGLLNSFGWKREEHCADRVGLAVAHAHLEGYNPETSPRNMGDVDELLTDWSQYFLDPDGTLVPFMLFELDNAHGPADDLFNFCMGILFFLRDLDICAGVSHAGRCSALQCVEKCNGALARRTRGKPIPVEHDAPDRMSDTEKQAVSAKALQTVVRLTHGATFKSGGNYVSVKSARSKWADPHPPNPDEPLKANPDLKFPWDSGEVTRFWKANEAEKSSFVWRGTANDTFPAAAIVALLRKVWRAWNLKGDDRLFFKTDHASVWRKTEKGDHPEHLAPRGPVAFIEILTRLGDCPLPWPSGDLPQNYMPLEASCRSG